MKFNLDKLLAIIFVCLAIFTIGMFCGRALADRNLKLQAIREHKAHYEHDSQGFPVFKWN